MDTMDLKDFVRESLLEIVAAVQEAQSQTPSGDGGARVAPRLTYQQGIAALLVDNEDGGGQAFVVEFDLSVVVTEATEMKAGGGAKVGIVPVFSAKADASGTANEKRAATQRIRFSVPVRYPQTEKAAPPRIPPAPGPGGPNGWMAR
jgi:hypothetical protein